MFEYRFEKVRVSALTGKPKEDYELLISQYAKEGWKLHTFTPLPFAAGGQAVEIQMIFERESE